MKFKVISFGLGPIGASIARVALLRRDVEVVGAVDSDRRLVGRDLGEIADLGKSTGIRITSSGKDLYKEANIVLHATTSYLPTARLQIIEFCRNRVDVVSTCEELSYPWFTHNRLARELDAAARKNGVTLLGTGVNPGFVMDFLPIALSGVCENISRIEVSRILDASKRRVPFQIKVGIGLSPREFRDKVRTHKFGHVGLQESIAMTCSALNMGLDKITERISSKRATKNVRTEHFGRIGKGQVIGLVQDAKGYSKGKQVASYHIEMYAGAKESFDEIRFKGKPNISLRIPGGTPGDIATAAIVVNSIPRVIEAKPGLLTVKDLRPAVSVSGS